MKKRNILLLAAVLIAPIMLIAQETSIQPETAFEINWKLYAYCFIGCFLQEFIYWFELRNDIAKTGIPVELKSKTCLLITLVAILIFSVGSYFYFLSRESADEFFTVAVFAAGFPRLFKSAVYQLRPPRVAPDARLQSPSFGIKNYLMMIK